MGLLDRWRSSPPPHTRTRGEPPIAITAAAGRIDRGDNDMLRRLQQGWQTRAFGYYKTIPEIWFASQFYSRALSNLEIYVASVNPNTGELERVEDDQAVQDYVERMQDPGGGRAGWLSAYGRLMFVNGEGFLLVTTNPDTGAERWEFLSVNELRPQGDGSFTRYKAPSLNAEEIRLTDDENWEPLPPECVAYRFWRRDPEYSALADAPMRAVLDLCDELMWLTQAVLARAKSRLSAGVLVIPDQLSFPTDQAVGEEDAAEDEWLAEINEHFIAGIENPGSASAVAPYLMRIDGQWAEKVRLIEMQDPSKFYPETGLRMECIKRIAMGLDLPPEVLLGTADANHWTAWSIDEQTWKAHLQPIAQMLVDDLTAAYLKPALRADGYGNWDDYVVAFDASAIINHPDRSSDALNLYKEGVLSPAALRDANGFDDNDAPTEDEWDRWAGVVMRDSSLAKYGIPGRVTNVEPVAGELEAPAGGGGGDAPVTTPAASSGTAPPPEPAAPAQPAAVAASAATDIAMLNGAIRISLTRCRELAGARIVSHAQGDLEARALIRDVPKHQVACTLGKQRTLALAPAKTPRELVKGGTETLAATLVEWGVELAVASRTCQAVEQHAARTLYDEKPGLLPEMIS